MEYIEFKIFSLFHMKFNPSAEIPGFSRFSRDSASAEQAGDECYFASGGNPRIDNSITREIVTKRRGAPDFSPGGSTKKIIFVNLTFFFIFFICGCASLAKLIVGKDGVEIPQIVAHLEPSLADNRITISGKIVIQNPTKSSLDLDKIYLEIRNENKSVLEKFVLEWEMPSVTSKHELEAPVRINLSLAVLNNKNITVFIRTGFTYKQFGLHIPVESKVAVLHLEALKEIIARPFYVNIFTKLHSTIFGNSSVDFVIGTTNPLSIDLVLEDGIISVNTLEGKDIAKTKLARTLFKGSQSNQIKGSVKIGNIWGRLLRSESVKKRPLKFQLSGHMRIPNTDIFIPFKIESVVEIKLSFS